MNESRERAEREQRESRERAEREQREQREQRAESREREQRERAERESREREQREQREQSRESRGSSVGLQCLCFGSIINRTTELGPAGCSSASVGFKRFCLYLLKPFYSLQRNSSSSSSSSSSSPLSGFHRSVQLVMKSGRDEGSSRCVGPTSLNRIFKIGAKWEFNIQTAAAQSGYTSYCLLRFTGLTLHPVGKGVCLCRYQVIRLKISATSFTHSGWDE